MNFLIKKPETGNWKPGTAIHNSNDQINNIFSGSNMPYGFLQIDQENNDSHY